VRCGGADDGADVAALYTSKAEAGEAATLPPILQFSSEDMYTKYEMCELFAQILGLGLDGMERDTKGNEGNTGVQRPFDCHLSTRALRELGIEVHTQDFKGWWRWELHAVRR
jgi:S-adenosylmethionine synthetase